MKGLKKVLSGHRRSSEAHSEGYGARRQDSVDSLTIDQSPDRSSRSSPSRESQSGGYKKLLPGHSKRKRRRAREEELRAAVDDIDRGRTLSEPELPRPTISRKASTVGDSSLLTDDSEHEGPVRPPLIDHDSYAGLLTHSSPLVKTETSTDKNAAGLQLNHAATVPALVEPPHNDESPSPKSPPTNVSLPSLPSMGLIDKADALRPDKSSDSLGRLRAKSPARKFRDVFSKGSKSPRVSPERKGESVSGVNSPLARSSTVGLGLKDDVPDKPHHLPPPISTSKTLPNLETDSRPLTPPTAMIATPLTTVTPPTPTDTRFSVSRDDDKQSTVSDKDDSETRPNPNITVSPSGNMISHRRVRSASSASREPSKLSNSITAPLTPTIEEVRTPAGSVVPGSRNASGSFFSSWMSAAQNAATTFSNLTGPNRSRAGTTTSDPMGGKSIDESIKEEPEDGAEIPKKQLAVETMGTGDLNFEHLGLDDARAEDAKSRMAGFRDSALVRDMAAAKEEDALAKRAVSAAYEKPETVPVAEAPDSVAQPQPAKTVAGSLSGEQTPPNGSIYEGETMSVKRTNSVRSRLANRRSRGSSTATGQSAIGAMIGASTAALVNPTTAPRLSGFAVAPKQRNRTFHQAFRSVPEDDYLIEDYSCALQKEIILAGRIYISEGHICFSSNILGWVTTLVISFEEVVSIERENTALVIPNAIAIQTLHARHTFRSLLSREATYELLLGIWKVSHPASFQKSQAGKEVIAEEATKEATGIGAADDKSEDGEESGEGESEGSEEDDDDDDTPSFVGSSGSRAGSEAVDVKSISRKASGLNGVPAVPAPAPGGAEVAAASAALTGAIDAPQDFPGPPAHAPTECNDSSTHYDIIIKDEVISAPLGKIYSLLYGPQSGVFMRKFLVDECKSLELALEDDKKGLGAEKQSRQYTYIKPLGGSIGPKQTKCITTEELEFYDLQRAVTVTCSTQTPDVPSGNAFLTKTRYCLTWAASNQTRLQMNCTIEWSAKSWLKGPIEKGAKDGQQQYGDSLLKSLKAAVGRPRGLTSASKGAKKGKKRKGERSRKSEKVEAVAAKDNNWGLLEPLRGPLSPIVDVLRPVLKTEILIGVLFFLVTILWLRGPSGSGQLGPYGAVTHGTRFAAYEEMWRKEESELWEWLESRTGLDTISYRKGSADLDDDRSIQRQKQKQRQKVLKGKDVASKLREETMAEKEVEEAIRITRERLEVLEGVVNSKKTKRDAQEAK
ncbi:uncharacterized protein HMPREF1541_05122 [Cyphellophora europaea CBS 101466]|uniref:VASt domain-containing protein n=1 Tax=Cyphellophora europaea (strain CBS 101466) TaxID=1220924 RepID=W2RWL7_CYPE1|nr:uncharacterized protein HMPREF1541_05122 [Cyphellophora europaea CBS 101466]ETN40842.1 hypothetical protein HMPREF1541_05122 [Cyphellophora europaea CBS 101466]